MKNEGQCARMPYLALTSRVTAVGLFLLLLNGCPLPDSRVPPSIEFTEVPEAAFGGTSRMQKIAGRVNQSARPAVPHSVFNRLDAQSLEFLEVILHRFQLFGRMTLPVRDLARHAKRSTRAV